MGNASGTAHARLGALFLLLAAPAAWGWAVALLTAAVRVSAASVSAPGPATADQVLGTGAAAVALVLLSWLALVVLASVPSALRQARRGGRGVPSGPGIAPAAVRRAVTALMCALILGSAAAQSAAATDLDPGRALSPAWVDTTSAPMPGAALAPGWGETLPTGSGPAVAPASPSTASPSTASPSTAGPKTVDPATSLPATARSATARPPTARPAIADPAGADPAGADPAGADPAGADLSPADGSSVDVSGVAGGSTGSLDPGWAPAPPESRNRVKPQVELPGARIRPTATESSAAVVRRGDTLWDLAARHLGPGAGAAEVAAEWPRWWQTNRHVIGPDPDVLRPGQRLTPPGEPSLAPSTDDTTTTTTTGRAAGATEGARP